MTKYPSQEMDRFNVRLPSGMREAIAERAKANGRSMNSEIVQILQDALDVGTNELKEHKLADEEISVDSRRPQMYIDDSFMQQMIKVLEDNTAALNKIASVSKQISLETSWCHHPERKKHNKN